MNSGFVATVSISSHDPVQLFWKMVFSGVLDPGAALVVVSKDTITGISTVRLNLD